MHRFNFYPLAVLALIISSVLALSTARYAEVPSVPIDTSRNGYYHVAPGVDGPVVVSFTPIEELNITVIPRATVEPLSARALNGPKSRAKRAGGLPDSLIQCQSGTLNSDHLGAAQACLRAGANHDQYWDANHWGYCRNFEAMAYGCAYVRAVVLDFIVDDYEVSIDRKCGWPHVGWAAGKFGSGYAETGLNIGRTFYGVPFCDGSFIGN